MKRLALLDRDGTIIVDRGFLSDPAGVELLPGAVGAIKQLNAADWAVAIATNQSGVGRGLYSLAAMHATNARVVEILSRAGARIDAVEFCPHSPEAGAGEFCRACDCRKPAPGMARAAAEKLGVSLAGAVVIGDRLADVKMGLAIGGAGVLVLTGLGVENRGLAAAEGVTPSAIVPDLGGAVEWLLARGR